MPELERPPERSGGAFNVKAVLHTSPLAQAWRARSDSATMAATVRTRASPCIRDQLLNAPSRCNF
eukprot:1179792-Prorocentrum_minimum.AAC.3